MFWETKLAELQKLAPVEFESLPRTELSTWRATLDGCVGSGKPFGKGITKAAAVCELWKKLVESGESFRIMTGGGGDRTVRWNGRWQDEISPKKEEVPAELMVVEELPDLTFDPAD